MALRRVCWASDWCPAYIHCIDGWDSRRASTQLLVPVRRAWVVWCGAWSQWSAQHLTTCMTCCVAAIVTSDGLSTNWHRTAVTSAAWPLTLDFSCGKKHASLNVFRRLLMQVNSDRPAIRSQLRRPGRQMMTDCTLIQADTVMWLLLQLTCLPGCIVPGRDSRDLCWDLCRRKQVHDISPLRSTFIALSLLPNSKWVSKPCVADCYS